jgi:hypothetical protein
MLRALYLTSSARYTRVKGEWSGDEWKDPEMFDTLLKENDYRQVRALSHTHAAPLLSLTTCGPLGHADRVLGKGPAVGHQRRPS